MSLTDKFNSPKFKQNTSIKMLIIGLLLLLLMIPMSMVSSLVTEREYRKQEVVAEINQKWGHSQQVTGPYLTLPYKAWYTTEEQQQKYRIRHLHFLPEQLDIQGEILPHVRYRSIYEAVLYNARLQITGSFSIPDLQALNIKTEDVLWSKSSFALGLTDMRGIKQNIELSFSDNQYQMQPGLVTQDLAAAGVSTQVAFAPDMDKQSFSLMLDLNGSQQLHFTPLARTTEVALSSDWPSPSFNGAFLPEQHQVTAQGFNANWQVLHLNRNYPQLWSDDQYQVLDSAFGLELVIPADIYQKSTRLHKYGLIFILFTFTALFLSEVTNRAPLHPIQYILMGLGIVLFYSLQLALSEHLGFDWSYILAAITTLILLSSYTLAITQKPRFALIVATILLILYGYLYLVLQLQDYALLMGSIGLTAVLATVMYTTRKIDWYAQNQE